jgi:hypothetical protein
VRQQHLSALALFAALSAGPASAGTVISTNLPPGDVIVNINALQDGAATYNGFGRSGLGQGQDLWYQPFNTNGNLLEVTLQPGTYQFQVINQGAAAKLFPSLTQSQLNQIGAGAWSYNSPWVTDYLAFDVSALNNPQEHQLFSGAVTPASPVPGSTGWNGGGYNTAAEAYQAAILGGYYDTIVTNGGRYSGTTVSSYTFSSPETLIFVIPDNDVGDNQGILSVLITSNTSAVPEPPSLATGLLAGTIGFVVWLRRRRAPVLIRA